MLCLIVLYVVMYSEQVNNVFLNLLLAINSGGSNIISSSGQCFLSFLRIYFSMVLCDLVHDMVTIFHLPYLLTALEIFFGT